MHCCGTFAQLIFTFLRIRNNYYRYFFEKIIVLMSKEYGTFGRLK